MIFFNEFHPMWKRHIIILPCLMILLIACQSSRVEAPQSQTPISLTQTQRPSPELPDSPTFSSASILESTDYVVQERLTLINYGPGQPSKQNLWVALIQDVFPYQEVSKTVISPENYQVVTDEYGNKIAEFDFSEMPAGTEIRVKIDYQVRVNHLVYDLSQCEGDNPDFFTQPELHIEVNNPQIRTLADQLSERKQTACEQIRAFYDYIGNNLVYSYNGKDWGAQAALGEMGADCTEYSSLMMALSRAIGIPARYFEGLNYSPEDTKSLARTEHAWLEVYLPGIGWTPMDPTLGRSSITREDYFATLPADHIIVSRGRNPSTLRGKSYWTHIYWPGNSTDIKIEEFQWLITTIN